jgi:hypothetical protein
MGLEARGSEEMRAREFMERLERHPEFREKFEELLGVAENAAGDAVKADEAEERITEELRKLGQLVLQGWANRKNERVTAEAERREEMTHKEKKRFTGTAAMDESK